VKGHACGSDTSPCYLSTLQRKDETEEEEFYELSKTCNRYRSITCSFFMTFNAKTGNENHRAQIAGKYIIHNETSVYGNLLPQTAQTHHENLL
jgi:hypothetical protein